MDLSQPTFTKFDTKAKVDPKKNCVFVDKKGNWIPEKCDKQMLFICQVPTNSTHDLIDN